ncbi:MAG TPA: nucleotidyltransferase domain-containing protein [Ilumatobacteraceae bacterium]|nr:nucleotidyltransferase domain-containing protein [Ilumatobacteraceae bacterium]
MYLNHPIEALASPDKARVLTVLCRAGLPLSGRMIASLTGSVSQPTVSRLLATFARSGLVLRVPGGYEINREHLAYRAVEALLDSRDELRRRVGKAVATWSDEPVAVVLFGSTARGEAGRSSDVDLLIVRPLDVAADDPQWAQAVATLAEQVQLWTGSACDVLEYDPAELEQLTGGGDPLVDALLRDGVTLAGSELRRIMGAFAG